MNEKLYRRVVWNVLIAGSFSSIAELSEAVKGACVRLRLPYDAGEVHAAIASMQTQIARELVDAVTIAPEPPVESRPLTRDEAAAAYRRFVHSPIKTVAPPTLAEIDPRAADRRAAILDEIAATIARVEALERERPE